MDCSLKAPQVRQYIERLGQVKYRQFDFFFTCDPKSYELLDELFELLHEIGPVDKNKTWGFWLTAESGSVADYGDYNEWLDSGEVNTSAEFEKQWKNEYPDETEWFKIKLTVYSQPLYDVLSYKHNHLERNKS